jgi:hypothetical protein
MLLFRVVGVAEASVVAEVAGPCDAEDGGVFAPVMESVLIIISFLFLRVDDVIYSKLYITYVWLSRYDCKEVVWYMCGCRDDDIIIIDGWLLSVCI